MSLCTPGMKYSEKNGVYGVICLILLILQTTIVVYWQRVSYEGKGAPTQQFDGSVVYVNEANNVQSPDGRSWSTAYSSITQALEGNMFGKKEIWIAKGTYSVESDDVHRKRFSLVSGIGLYGGFIGNEAFRDERDWKENITVLSGIRGGESDLFHNVYNVVFGAGILSIVLPNSQSQDVALVPELVLHIARSQCDMAPVL